MPSDIEMGEMIAGRGTVSTQTTNVTGYDKFSITQIYLNNLSIKSGSNINTNEYLIPDESVVTVLFTLAENYDINNYRIKILSKIFNTNEYIGKYYDLSSTINNLITIKIPKLYSGTTNLEFTTAMYVTASGDTGASGLFDTDQGKCVTNTLYLYPFYAEVSEHTLLRYDDNYTNTSAIGKKIKVDKLKLNLISGQPEQIDYNNIYLVVNSNNENSEGHEILLSEIAAKLLFSDGYEDTDSYILSELNETLDMNGNSYFSNLEFEYNFAIKIKILYNALVSLFFTTQEFYLTLNFTSLLLVGKTVCSNNKIVYGGVAIGQNPTINEIGEPAFECGYPAYFRGVKYGFTAGETLILNNNYYSVNGYITNGKRDLNFTINLGTPIFASEVSFTGNILILVDGVSIAKTYTVELPGIIINQRAGIISFHIYQSSIFSSSTINLKPCAVIPNNNMTIIFK